MMLDAIDRRYISTPTTLGAQIFPATGGELRGKAYDMTSLNFLSDSTTLATRGALDEVMNPLFASEDEMRKVRQQSVLLTGKPADELGGRKVVTDYEANYVGMARALRAQGLEPPSYEDIQTRAGENAVLSKEEFARASAFNVSSSPRLQSFAGMAGSGVSDPVILAATAMSVPLAMTTNVVGAAAVEGAIGLVSEAIIQAEVYDWQNSIGEEYTAADVATALAMGTLLPAGFAGGMSAAYRRFGGTNAKIFNGPMGTAQSAVDEMRASYNANLLHSRSLSDPRVEEGVITGKGASEGEVSLGRTGMLSYTQPLPFAGAFSPPMQYQATAKMVDLLPDGSEARYRGLTQVSNDHLTASNPARGGGVLATGKSPDVFSYLYHRADMDSMHSANLRQAMEAAARGDTITPPHGTTLSAEVFGTASDVRHVNVARQMLADGVPTDLTKPAYRTVLHGLVQDAATLQLQRQADQAVLPPAPAIQAPRVDTKTLLARQGEITKKLAELDKSQKLLQEHRVKLGKYYDEKLKADEADLDPPELPDFYATPEKMDAAQKKLDTQRTALQKKSDTFEEALNLHELAAANKNQRDAVAAAKAAQRQLDELAKGKIPKELHDMRDKFHDSLDAISNSKKYMDDAFISTEAGDVMMRAAPTLNTWDPNRSVTTTLGDYVKIIDEAESPEVNKAWAADFDRLDSSFTYRNEDGVDVSVQSIKDEMKDAENAIEALKTCNLPGTPA